MKRPLVWVGIAYVTGEILAAAGTPFWAILAAVTIIFLIILTGRRQRQANAYCFLFLLPVFVLSGFVVFSRAQASNHVEAAGLPQTVVLTGTIDVKTEKETNTALEVRNARITSVESEADSDIFPSDRPFGVMIYAAPDMAFHVQAGDRIRVSGKISLPDAATNPGQFDMRSYLNARGFQYVCYPDQIEILSSSLSYRSLLLKLRRRMARVFLRLFGETEGGIACAMILGETTCLPEDVRQLYQEMGIVHILAISGLHISVAGNGLFRILLRCGISQRHAALFSAFTVISYGVLTGLSPSTGRAVIMFSVSMAALYLGRSYDMMSSASLAALILFTRYPLMLLQAGMQFSFGAICALGILFPEYRKLWEKRPHAKHEEHALLRRFLSMAAPSMAVTITTLPVSAWHYFSLPLLSLPLNLIVIPAMSILVPLCFLTGLLGLLSLHAGAAFGGAAFTLLRLSLLLCRAADRLPMTTICCGRPPAVVILLYYCLLLLPLILHRLLTAHRCRYGNTSLLSVNNRRPHLQQRAFRPLPRRLCVLCILPACLLLSFPWQRSQDRIAFLDVGQGDGIVMRCDSRTCLIDGGSSSEKEVGKYIIEPFLNYYGLDHVDYAFVSHGDEDHISGLRQLITDGRLRHLVLTKASRDDPAAAELAQLAGQHGATVAYIKAGDAWSFGDWNFACLYPGSEEKSDDRNALSMILRVDKDSFRLLLTGDISSEQEQKLSEEEIRNCTVLKCAHHGSRFSSSEDFLRAAHPKITVISCAARNRYGHPAPETVDRLSQAGSRICYTMQSGAILMQTDEKKLRLWGFSEP